MQLEFLITLGIIGGAAIGSLILFLTKGPKHVLHLFGIESKNKLPEDISISNSKIFYSNSSILTERIGLKIFLN